ncbi:MAG: hypothetical protein ACI97A_002106 [Planctomycetota bacterium]|jgi:hypothetical protein
MSKPFLIFIVLLVVCGHGPTAADEGFWTFERPPIEQLAKRYGLKTDGAWFAKIERATIKIGGRMGAAVVVSPDGLVMMTRHQIEGWISELGFVGASILEDGFLATRRERELKLEGLTAEQFHSLRDVTSLIADRMSSSESKDAEAERAAIRQVVEAESTRTGLLCRVQRDRADKRFVLYRFRVWNDLRLVFSPESSMAKFGGDFDNFSFPRWSFDVALLRLYDGGKPSMKTNFLQLNADPIKDGEVLVSTGYPRSTRRNEPWPILVDERLSFLPLAETLLSAMRDDLASYCAKNRAHTTAKSQLSSVSNSLKAIQGYRVALDNKRIVDKIRHRELLVTQKGGQDAKNLLACAKALTAELKAGRHGTQRRMCSRLESRIASRARSLLDLASALKQKPANRSKRYRGTNLEEMRSLLRKPVETDFELEVLIAGTRTRVASEILDKSDPFVLACREAANGKGALEALRATRLIDPLYCQELVDGAPKSIDKSADPMIALVRQLDPIWSELWGEMRVRSRRRLKQLRQDYLDILDRLAPGSEKTVDPSLNTNGTPRISIGMAAGYGNGVTAVPSSTSLWGLLARQHAMGAKSPFKLSPRWTLARDRLELDTQMVVATTLEVVENASGSPVVGRNGQLRGIVFDTNFEGLAHVYVHDSERGRALVLSSSIILEVLQKVYRADSLMKELAYAR